MDASGLSSVGLSRKCRVPRCLGSLPVPSYDVHHHYTRHQYAETDHENGDGDGDGDDHSWSPNPSFTFLPLKSTVQSTDRTVSIASCPRTARIRTDSFDFVINFHRNCIKTFNNCHGKREYVVCSDLLKNYCRKLRNKSEDKVF